VTPADLAPEGSRVDWLLLHEARKMDREMLLGVAPAGAGDETTLVTLAVADGAFRVLDGKNETPPISGVVVLTRRPDGIWEKEEDR
jgi:hypothetical protein